VRRSQRGRIQPDQRQLPPYDEIGLVLQGGGALGSYQADVYGQSQSDVACCTAAPG